MSYAERVKRDGPLVFWRLEQSSGTTATDTSDNGNDGTWSAEPTWGVTGAIGNAVEVASGQHIQLSAGPDPVADWAIEGWFNAGGSWPSTRATIGAAVDASTAGEYLDLAIDSGKLVHSRGAATSGDSISVDLSSYDASAWHHAVLRQTRVDATTVEVEVWLDGALVGSASGDWADASLPWEFGGVGGGGSPWNRQLDELAVFTYAVTPQQIRRHYWDGQGYTGYALEVLAAGSNAYWRLDESSGAEEAVDSVGSLNATAGTDTTFGANPLIRRGQSVSFDGSISSDLLTIPDDVAIKPTDTLSIGAWLNTSTTGTATIYEKESGGPWQTLGIDGANGDVAWLRLTVAGTRVDVRGTTALTDGTAHYVIGTYDGAEAVVYVDGVREGSVSVTGTLDYTTQNGRIGGLSGGTELFAGRIDEVAVYGRAVTGQEIRRHYELGLAENSYRIEVLSSLPFAYYKLDETDTGDGAEDHAGTNSGSYIGSPTLDANPIWDVGGSSMDCDGSDDYVDTGITSLPTDALVVEALAEFPSDIDSSKDYRIVCQDKTGSQGTFNLWLNGLVLRWAVDDGGGYDNSGLAVMEPAPDAIHHIVAMYDVNTGERWVYVDGELTANDAIKSGGLSDDGQPIVIGADSSGGSQFWQNRLDEVAIYRRLLSEAEVKRHYYVAKFGPVLGTIFFIAGVVTDESTGDALDATVRAYRWSDGALLQSTTSDPSTGEYRIEGIGDTDLLVVMQPPSGLRPLAHGPVKPAEEA